MVSCLVRVGWGAVRIACAVVGSIEAVGSDIRELVAVWGVRRFATIVSVGIGGFIIETFLTDPYVDHSYVDGGTVSVLRRTRYIVWGLAQVWTNGAHGWGWA